MYETLLRPHQVDAVPAPPSIASVSAHLKRAEARREEKRLRQIAQAQRQGAKRKRADDDLAPTSTSSGDAAEQDADAAKGKRAKTEESEDTDALATPAAPGLSAAATPVRGTPAPGAKEEAAAGEEGERKVSVSKAFAEVRGHTSYLTFAVLLPASVYEAASAPASGTATPQAAS